VSGRAPPEWTCAELRSHLQALIEVLDEASDLLDAVPFRNPDPAWIRRRPALATALLALDEDAVERLELDPVALASHLTEPEPLFGRVRALTRVPVWPTHPDPEPPARLVSGIPGRKLLQIRAFATTLDPDAAPAARVEWCSGRSHLGRLLAHRQGIPVRALERDPALCRSGAERAGELPLRFEICDVITDAPVLAAEEEVLALHACGRLHETLVRRALTRPIAGLALAPCCYHLLGPGETHWQPMSRTGPAEALPREQARLAVAETVTAPARVRRLRRRERAFRLGLGAFLQSRDGGEIGRPLPSVPESVIAAGFDAFCRFVTEREGPEPDSVPDSAKERWLAEGYRLDARVRRLDLARADLRRALELRMVLDRALALAEAGHRVGVGTFCERRLTPRNLLIRTLDGSRRRA
jgi:hypothetical protein